MSRMGVKRRRCANWCPRPCRVASHVVAPVASVACPGTGASATASPRCSSKPSSKPRATPAPFTGHRAGSMSGPPRGGDVPARSGAQGRASSKGPGRRGPGKLLGQSLRQLPKASGARPCPWVVPTWIQPDGGRSCRARCPPSEIRLSSRTRRAIGTVAAPAARCTHIVDPVCTWRRRCVSSDAPVPKPSGPLESVCGQGIARRFRPCQRPTTCRYRPVSGGLSKPCPPALAEQGLARAGDTGG